MAPSITISGDLGTIITAIGTLIIGLIQLWQGSRSKQWREDAGRKIDENTSLTRSTAATVVAVVASATGSLDVGKLRADHDAAMAAKEQPPTT